MNQHQEPLVSFLVLDFLKHEETKLCLESIRAHAKIPHKIILLDNGGKQDYSWEFYKNGLCDVIISKAVGRGGGYGQTDLFRWCDTKYAIFVQQDQQLMYDIGEGEFNHLVTPLSNGYHCVDLNGDQSRRGVWTDRAHLIETAFFNSLGPFPNGGPGLDNIPWNEEFLQKVFAEKGYKILHLQGPIFSDGGKWSIREAGDGLYRHRCDVKSLYVLRKPTYKTEVYPPFNDEEWAKALAGKWVDGDIPEAWKAHSFVHWRD